MMSTHNRRLVWLVLVVVAVGTAAYYLFPESNHTPLSTRWTPGPDAFPIGKILEGSTVEMSVGFLSDAKPTPRPAWVSTLPLQFRELAERFRHRHRASAYRRDWQVRADVPDFLCLEQIEVGYQPIHGPFPSLAYRLTNAVAGDYEGRIRVELIGRGHQSSTVTVPVKVTVLPGTARWRVLLVSSPFEKYATGFGRDFEPLTAITSRLAEHGVRVDFLRELPMSLKGYDVVLIGGSTLVAGLNQADFAHRLHLFVAGGGRLIVAADGFYFGTTAAANTLLSRYGLEMDTKEAQPPESRIPVILPDPFTTGVSELNFWRGSFLWSTDDRQARVLALRKDDAGIGFLGVSRAAGRGDVILLAQSLWWNRLAGDNSHGDNARLLENLLAP